ncbi:TPA: hypothetical protein HA361_02690 [Candidatus Woesearchaeota archaeon]|nr:hypothetical protein [Candidatus Woesearchaeota archaeon]HII69458.1 hypothetical protein [Candidatus Woesearchaeota archaeon]
MLQMPYAEIVEKIKEKSDLSDADIQAKVDEKLEQLSGLISREGAAHIIANELGIKVFDGFSGRLKVKNIMAGMRDVELVAKVLAVYEVREFTTAKASGKVASLMAGDETGSIRIVMWGDKADAAKEISSGNIIKVQGAYVKENNHLKELHMGDRGALTINPEGEAVGEIKQTAGIRKQIAKLTESDDDVEVMGTIVQLFEPRFFEIDPDTKRRAHFRDGQYVCDGKVIAKPDYSYVMNAFLDDGTDNIRAVFFRNQALQLLSISHEEMLKYKESPELFEDEKTKMLGEIIKIRGRVSKNQMFDRLEIVARTADPHPNPKEELRRLEAEKPA